MRRVFVLRSILILFALYSFSTGAEPQNRTGAGKGKKGKRAGNSCYGQTGNENVQLVLHAHFTIQESNLPRNISGRVNTDFWLDKNTRDPRHTQGLRHLLQNKFALGR